MYKYLSSIGKVSRGLLIVLAVTFVLLSLGGIFLVASAKMGGSFEPSVGTVADTGLSSAPSAFQDLSSGPIVTEGMFVSEDVRIFMGMDYMPLSDFSGENVRTWAIISKVLAVDEEAGTISLWVSDEDLEFLSTDVHIKDNVFVIEVTEGIDIFAYDLKMGLGRNLTLADISVDDVVAHYVDWGVIYARVD